MGLLFFPTQFKLVIDDSVAMTPFYLLLGKHRCQTLEIRDKESSWGSAERTPPPPPKGSVAVKEVSQRSMETLQSFHFWILY